VEHVERPRSPVTRPRDGSVEGGISSGPDQVILSIDNVYKGTLRGRIRLRSDFRFAARQRYLVYISTLTNEIAVSVCSRTRALADATEDLAFLDGIGQARPQGILYGMVVGAPAERAVYTVVAQSGSHTRRVNTSTIGAFDLVLPPGSYLVWVEHDGRGLTNPSAIDIRDGDERRYEFGLAPPV
jgi:hypothetical protein